MEAFLCAFSLEEKKKKQEKCFPFSLKMLLSIFVEEIALDVSSSH